MARIGQGSARENELSGQRWAKAGAQNMLQLRVTKMNNQWAEVIKLVQTEFKIAA